MGAVTSDRRIEEFLKYCRTSKSLSRHTISAYAQDLNEFSRFRSLFPDGPTLGPDRILKYIAYLQDDRELKPASIRRRIACLRSFLKWQERQGHIKSSPFRELDLNLKVPKRLPRALSRQQLVKVTKAASQKFRPNHASKHASEQRTSTKDIRFTTQLAIRLMATTGVRVGELTSIALANVSDDGSTIRIVGKGDRERTVFVGSRQLKLDLRRYLEERLAQARNNECLLVNQRGRPLTPQSLRLRLRKISEDLSISPRVTPHCFRHTAATLLLEEGVDIRFVQRLLGHSSISTTEIYTDISQIAFVS